MTYGWPREDCYKNTNLSSGRYYVVFYNSFVLILSRFLKYISLKSKNYIIVFHSFKGNALWVQFVNCACADQFTVGFWQKMASAKFLEEALTSTDVDESAVNALVGSLETSLVTSAPAVSNQQGIPVNVNQNHLNSAISNGSSISSQKHGVLNGGSDSMNIILNSDANKVISCSNHQSALPSVVNTVVASLHGGVQSSGYINQVTSNIGLVQSNITNLNKSQDTVKLVYPSCTQSITTTVGGINRVTYPTNQTVPSLPNGNIGLTTLTSNSPVLTVSNSSLQSVVSQSYSQAGTNVNKQVGGVSVIGMDQNKPTGTALVIKSSGNNHGPQGVTQGLVSVPMTVGTTAMTLTGTHVNATLGTTTTSGVPGVVTLTKPINQSVGSQPGIVGNNQTLIPANVQILNVNAIRPGTQVQSGQKTASPRVMTIGTSQMVGARPGQPGQPITVQTLQSLQGGQGGTLLLKTENGYQLLRVGPPQTPTAAIAPNNATNTTAFRVQSVPAGGTAVAGTVQTQVPALTTQTTAATMATTPQRLPSADTVKEKCRKFLANLMELSSREPKAVERNVRTLIQELVDSKVEPEEFCDRLERLLNASPQPCLIGFLKKSLPLLRQAMVAKELVIDGIRPPPVNVVYHTSNIIQQTIQQPTTRPQAQVQVNATPQMRLITQAAPTTVVGTSPRASQSVQHRIVTPLRVPAPGTKVAPGTPIVGLRPQTPLVPGNATAIRLQTPIRTTTLAKPGQHTTVPIGIKAPALAAAGLKPGQILTKATIATRPVGSPLATTSLKQPIHGTAPSILLKAVTGTKEKEKKTYSSTGYTGDDDINDVAAMGGVNLAEETQRILGSTEFVGTQIRSCKDDIYLHSTPLMQKINQIAAKHGLEEPSSEVAALISHATQERLKNLVEKLAVIAEHRIDLNKMDPRYEVSQDVRGQLKFLEELDRVERKRHDEQERELLLRAAKSRSKSEDPEQAKLKAKAKEMQRAEMEELRQREANLTALQAIGPRKKPRLDGSDSFSMSSQASCSSSTSNGSVNRSQTLRPRLKRVNIRDLLFLLESEKQTCHSSLLYRAYLK